VCGLCALVGPGSGADAIDAMAGTLVHRGPDAGGSHVEPGVVALGHRRLSIIDLSDAGRQPLRTPDGRWSIAFNGEIYNYLELRRELDGWPWQTATDTEVLLAAWARWGRAALDRLVGMFAFVVWDAVEQRLVGARDRFGVKPLYHARLDDGTIAVASEIKALHRAGVPRRPHEATWAGYLVHGVHDHDERTFWDGVSSVPPGHLIEVAGGRVRTTRWYDVAEATGLELDTRPEDVVAEEYHDLLLDSVRLRFRADVPVGINLSGGLDSSTLLATVHALQGPDSEVAAFTFVTGDPDYDETPWVREMLAATRHPLVTCALAPADVPALALDVARHQDEPYGGLPTLAYARLFERARDEGVTVLLDGQGMDEQWAGYDYYARAGEGRAAVVQGSASSPLRPEVLDPAFGALATPLAAERPFGDPLRDLQYRDLRRTKLQRAMRFNDRVSMRASRELREPFLDHRLVELALRQPADRKIHAGQGKALLRRIVRDRLPARVVDAPKRPVQTPQREWLRGPLREWFVAGVDEALASPAAPWFDAAAVRRERDAFLTGAADNSYFAWQWLSVAMCLDASTGRPLPAMPT
jgi:asparagine synthase (glutamine-hydrolysing)